MSIVLSLDAMQELDWYLGVYIGVDSRTEEEFELHEFGGYNTECDDELLAAGVIATNPTCMHRHYITQTGVDYLGATIKVVTPFDEPAELTAARAEIVRLNSLLTTLETAYNGLGELYKAELKANQRIAPVSPPGKEYALTAELRKINPDEMTPIEALAKLYELKRMLK